jgi:hypothetical protein
MSLSTSKMDKSIHWWSSLVVKIMFIIMLKINFFLERITFWKLVPKIGPKSWLNVDWFRWNRVRTLIWALSQDWLLFVQDLKTLQNPVLLGWRRLGMIWVNCYIWQPPLDKVPFSKWTSTQYDASLFVMCMSYLIAPHPKWNQSCFAVS